jgi:hypothetical protein
MISHSLQAEENGTPYCSMELLKVAHMGKMNLPMQPKKAQANDPGFAAKIELPSGLRLAA